MTNYKLFTDGSYQQTLQIAGIGGYLLDPEGKLVFDFSESIEDPSSFKYHESIALMYGLEKAVEHGVKNLECFSDDKSFRELFNQDTLSENSSSVNPFRKNIFNLKMGFETIKFHHILRNFNRKADKLAGKALKTFREEKIPHKTREDFIGKEDKILNINNLICDEDFKTLEDKNKFIENNKKLTSFFLLDITKNHNGENNIDIASYFIKKDLNNYKNIQSTLLDKQTMSKKDLFKNGIYMLTKAFYNSKINGDVGLIINAPQALQRLEMVLRKRGVLHLPNTELIQNFLESTKKFTNIVLDNNEKIINQHTFIHFKQAETIIEENNLIQEKIQYYVSILKQLTSSNYTIGLNPSIENGMTDINKLQNKYFGEFIKLSIYAYKLSHHQPFDINSKINDFKQELYSQGIKFKM